MDPNRFLVAAIAHLYADRPSWHSNSAVGKTIVSSSMINRVAAKLRRRLFEVPVGFKWFSAGLGDGSLGFAGEESAGASFARRDGSAWTTDKDGLILGLLAAEITAKTEKDPHRYYETVTDNLGQSFYQRTDVRASPAQMKRLSNASAAQFSRKELGGESVEATLTCAPGNNQPIGGIKIIAENGWFAARPSGTENIYKIYAESFRSDAHLRQIRDEAQEQIASIVAESR
jgi:phosphoglucomutase